MLQQYSWTQFLVSAAILTALWYLMVLLTAYRKEAFGFLSGKSPSPGTVSVKKAGYSEEGKSKIESELMGRSKMPEGLSVVDMGQLSFAPGGKGTLEDEKSDQLGLVPDVLQELKEIFGILAKEDGTKQDFFSLAAMISEKYGRIGSNPNIGKINEFIRDHAPFTVSLEELENLWD